MLTEQFFSIVAAVLVGNALSLLVGVLLWQSRQMEKKGMSAKDLPFPLLVFSLVPFTIVAFVALSLT